MCLGVQTEEPLGDYLDEVEKLSLCSMSPSIARIGNSNNTSDRTDDRPTSHATTTPCRRREVKYTGPRKT